MCIVLILLFLGYCTVSCVSRSWECRTVRRGHNIWFRSPGLGSASLQPPPQTSPCLRQRQQCGVDGNTPQGLLQLVKNGDSSEEKCAVDCVVELGGCATSCTASCVCLYMPVSGKRCVAACYVLNLQLVVAWIWRIQRQRILAIAWEKCRWYYNVVSCCGVKETNLQWQND